MADTTGTTPIKKTKVAFVTWAPRISGIEVALCAILENIDYDRFDVSVLFTSNEDYEGSSIIPRLDSRAHVYVADRTARVTFKRRYRFNLLRRVGGFLRWHVKGPFESLGAFLYDGEAKLYARYIRKNLGAAADVDTVVLYHPFSSEEAVRAFTRKRFLLVYHCGDREKIYHQEMGFAAADKVLSVGCSVACDIRRWYPKYEDKVVVAENLTDIPNVLKLSQEAPATVFSHDVVNIVSCIRLNPLKGVDLALEAVAKLVAGGLTNIHYHVIGWDLSEPEYRALVAKLGLERYVTLYGHQPNPYPLMKQADVYLQPSRNEALGLTVSEALLLGRPVVSTRTKGGLDQLSAPGVKGVLCDISSDAIAAALKPLVVDPVARAALRNDDYLAVCSAANKRRIDHLEELIAPKG